MTQQPLPSKIKHVSKRAQAVKPFSVMNILQRVAELEAQGRDIISLCVGEPLQGAPKAVRARAADIMTDGTPLGYSPSAGILPLRQALAGHYRKWYGLDLPAERFFVTTGSSGAFLLSFLACFDHGDRVALARPGYAAYKNILAGLDIDVVELDCGPHERFQPTVELLEEAHAHAPLDGLVLASPANPTGTMIPADQFERLSAWCYDHDVRIISDEIYHGITFTDSIGDCALQFNDDAIVISSFSKYWGMTGWRLGWAVLPENLVTTVAGLAGNFALCAPVPAQHAAVEAFSDTAYEEGQAALDGFAQARQYVLDAAPRLGWKELAPADGAFYMYGLIDDVLGPFETATQWCSALLENEGVAVSPGLDFDSVHGDRWVRISLAAGPQAVWHALNRIEKFQHSLA